MRSIPIAWSGCDYFGERALLKDEPRAVHVDAITNVTLAKIARDTFTDILGSLQTLMEQQFTVRGTSAIPSFALIRPRLLSRSPRDVCRMDRHRARVLCVCSPQRRVLQSVPILSHLSEGERGQVLDRFEEARYLDGAEIITEGMAGDHFYIVKEGRVECVKDGARH